MPNEHGQMNPQGLFRSLRPRPAPVATSATPAAPEAVAVASVASVPSKPASIDTPRATPQAFEVLAIGPWPILREVSLTAAVQPPALSEADKIRRRGADRTTLASAAPASALALPEVGAQLAIGLQKTREHWLSERFAQLKHKHGAGRIAVLPRSSEALAADPALSSPQLSLQTSAQAQAQRQAARPGLFREQSAPAVAPVTFDAMLSLKPVAGAASTVAASRLAEAQIAAPIGAPTAAPITEPTHAQALPSSSGRAAANDLKTVFSRLAAARHKRAQPQPDARIPLDLDPR